MHSCYYFVGSDQTFCLQSLCLLITVSLLEFYEKGKNMSGNLMDLTQANFENETAQGLTLVDFWAPWCGPCRQMAPAFAAAGDLEPALRLGKLDTEAEQAIAARYGIQSIPTLIVIAKGREVARQSGAMPTGAIIRWARQAAG